MPHRGNQSWAVKAGTFRVPRAWVWLLELSARCFLWTSRKGKGSELLRPRGAEWSTQKVHKSRAHSFYLARASSPTSPWVTQLYPQTLSLLRSTPSRYRPSRPDPAITSHAPLTASSGPVMDFHVFALLSLPAWVSRIMDDALVNHPSRSFVHQVPRPSRDFFIENQCLS